MHPRLGPLMVVCPSAEVDVVVVDGDDEDDTETEDDADVLQQEGREDPTGSALLLPRRLVHFRQLCS